MSDRSPSASRGCWTGSDGQTGVSPALAAPLSPGQTSSSGVSLVSALLYSDLVFARVFVSAAAGLFHPSKVQMEVFV